MATNNLGLTITVNGAQANKEIGTVNKSFLSLESQAVRSSRVMSSNFELSVLDMSRAARTSSDQIVRSMRNVQNETAATGGKMKALGNTLQTALYPIRMAAYILPGLGIAGIITLASDLLLKLIPIPDALKDIFKSSEDLRRENEQLAKSVREETKAFDDFYASLDKIRNTRSLIGLSGAARDGGELAQIRRSTDIAKVEYEDMVGKYNRLYVQSREYKIVGGRREPTEGAKQALGQFEQVQKDLTSAEQTYLTAKETLKSKELELEYSRTQEIKRQQDERIKNLKSYTDQTQAIEISAIQDAAARIGAQRELDIANTRNAPAGVGPQDVAARQIVINQKAIADLQNVWLSQTKQNKAFDPVDSAGDNFLKNLKAEHDALGDNIDVMGEELKVAERAYEQRGRLEDEALRQIQENYRRREEAVEGFIRRTFLTARSFADVWKQALMQVGDYAVSTIAKMVTSWTTGARQMTPGYAGAGAGTGGGFASMMPSFLGMGGSGGGVGGYPGTPPFMPNTAGGYSGAGGGMNFGGGLSNLKQFLGITPNVGAGFEGPMQSFGQLGLGGKLSQLGKSNAALMGGATLAMMGLQRGGVSGLAMTAAGGALIGFKYGGGLGAAIGGAIGAGAGLVRMFMKSAEDKVKEKVKSAYGVSIGDKKVLKQIVDMAKSNFGGNLDMAVKSQQVAELVRLYALTYGQNTGKLPQAMTPGSLSQEGGIIRQNKSYYNGQLQPSTGGGIPGYASGIGFVPKNQLAFLHFGERVLNARENMSFSRMEDFFGRLFTNMNSMNFGGGGSSSGGSQIFKLDGEATVNLLRGEAVHAVDRNPRVVQRASTRAMRSNYNRRESLALQVAPGLLTS